MPTKPFELQENIYKYLKFMSFVKNSSPLTIKAYRNDLMQAFATQTGNQSPILTNKLNDKELLQLCRLALNRWANLTLSTRNRKSATLKSFLNWAYQENLIETELAPHIICPKVPKKIPHFISVDEVMAVLNSFDHNEKSIGDLRDKALFLAIYGGGLRVSEACNLKWTNIHFATRSLRILGKGQKERLVVVPHLAIQAFKKLFALASNNIFVFGGSQALNPRVAYEWIRTRGAKAHLMKPLHPHALRHSFATHLLSSGANIRTLQELLGHESLQATEKYTHLGVDQLARTLENHHPLSIKK